mgnify:CR=1 FL=1
MNRDVLVFRMAGILILLISIFGLFIKDYISSMFGFLFAFVFLIQDGKESFWTL